MHRRKGEIPDQSACVCTLCKGDYLIAQDRLAKRKTPFPENPAKIADVLRYSISRKYGLNLTLTLALTLALTLTLSNCHMSRNSYYILYKILLMSPSYSLGCVSSV